ncbi:DUF3995 domain-containing protein [Nocardia sp. NPDC058379]|uniref:DUF3995 domain-containing protein n=1 Tax=unclassified Nocardia TaxID=2637762 RepID=UPI0036530C77
MRFRKPAARLATTGLGIAAAMHVVWVFSPWPFADRAVFAGATSGDSVDDAPGPVATAAAAATFAAAAYTVSAQAGLAPRALPARLGRAAVATVAGGLLLRGALGLVYSGFVSKRSLFTRWDLAVYSPFSLVVGALAAGVAVGDKESRADAIG